MRKKKILFFQVPYSTMRRHQKIYNMSDEELLGIRISDDGKLFIVYQIIFIAYDVIFDVQGMF